MGKRNKAGFTLVEILIVVVILGILAAIVVPQFTSASQEAIKGALQSQLQTINSQVELYRVRNQGSYPTFADGGENNGWVDLIGGEYLKEAPVNGFTGESVLIEGIDAVDDDQDSANGWAWDTDYTIYAVGYDPVNNLLVGEDDDTWTAPESAEDSDDGSDGSDGSTS
jgi:prepilin-type N-terminal cleavage/methylation domain-containing protein